MTDHLKAIEQRAKKELREYGLTKLGWTFRWDNATRRFGSCWYSKRVITLSKPLSALNSFAEAEDTILHEIAHALVGGGVGHGPKWVKKAQSIGCNGNRCYDRTVVVPPPKFVGTCPVCFKQSVANRRRVCACYACCRLHNGGKWTPKFSLRWTRR